MKYYFDKSDPEWIFETAFNVETNKFAYRTSYRDKVCGGEEEKEMPEDQLYDRLFLPMQAAIKAELRDNPQ